MNDMDIIAKQKEISDRYDSALEKITDPKRVKMVLEFKRLMCEIIHMNCITPDELDNVLNEFREVNAFAREYSAWVVKQAKTNIPPTPGTFSKN
jgi:hypothetical protein